MTNVGSNATRVGSWFFLALTPTLALGAQEPVESPPASSSWAAFVEEAQERHGELGERAAAFLSAHRPDRDEAVPREWLEDNLRLALEARAKFLWAQDVPEALFLNDVVPYAVLNETRENWRSVLLPIVEPLVRDCTTAEAAAQAINRGLFDAIEVHYNTGRKRPNASPQESIAQGRATCTGLTILLVDACRAVGIPARAAGVLRWHDDRGNHTWAEIWDGERWRFTGADEYDPKGLDRAWFVADASKATAGEREHAVWASSWQPTGHAFPLVWSRSDESVHAIDATERYTGDPDAGRASLAALGDDGGELSEEAAQRVARELWEARRTELARALSEEMAALEFRAGEQRLRIKEREFGEAPDGGRSLWISMHGGGGAPAAVNDRQWDNQIKLYEPNEGIYVAPRAPTDTWNLWHQAHVDVLFDRMINAYVALRGVDPNRIYLMGYSAGGDGVFQLAPRMADRFAAAAMMAGHPNETVPDGLRNLPFALYMGGNDTRYGRNEVAARWRDVLAELRAGDEAGYEHRVQIYEGKGHWMDGEDAEALPWMAQHQRRAWPRRVIWRQDDVVHDRFYWLSVDPAQATARPKIVAEVKGDTIAITTLAESGEDTAPEIGSIELHLSDELIDLDRELEVTWNGAVVWRGSVERTRGAIEASLRRLPDPARVATATLVVQRPAPPSEDEDSGK